MPAARGFRFTAARFAAARVLSPIPERPLMSSGDRPDRLARSVADLLGIVDKLNAKGVALRILSMGGSALDTGTPTGKLMLTMLGAVAEFERTLMLERQREGIAKAKAEGRYKGRKPTARAKAGEVHRLHGHGLRPTEIAGRLGIGRASVYRVLKEKGRT
jgi:DNA invertase Pin-like site-specific DNA recombinase